MKKKNKPFLYYIHHPSSCLKTSPEWLGYKVQLTCVTFCFPWLWLLWFLVCLFFVCLFSSTFVGTLKRTMSLGRLTRKRTRAKSTDITPSKIHQRRDLWVANKFCLHIKKNCCVSTNMPQNRNRLMLFFYHWVFVSAAWSDWHTALLPYLSVHPSVYLSINHTWPSHVHIPLNALVFLMIQILNTYKILEMKSVNHSFLVYGGVQ